MCNFPKIFKISNEKKEVSLSKNFSSNCSEDAFFDSAERLLHRTSLTRPFLGKSRSIPVLRRLLDKHCEFRAKIHTDIMEPVDLKT